MRQTPLSLALVLLTSFAPIAGCAAHTRYDGRGITPEVELIHAERQHAHGAAITASGVGLIGTSAAILERGWLGDSEPIGYGALGIGVLMAALGISTLGEANERITAAEKVIADQQLLARRDEARTAKERKQEAAQLDLERQRLQVERERLALERARLQAAGVVAPSEDAEFTKAVEREAELAKQEGEAEAAPVTPPPPPQKRPLRPLVAADPSTRE